MIYASSGFLELHRKALTAKVESKITSDLGIIYELASEELRLSLVRHSYMAFIILTAQAGRLSTQLLISQ